METMETNKTPKNLYNYSCEKCNFNCFAKGDWNKHILRSKHHKNMSRKLLETNKDKKTYDCLNCNKKFLTNSGLWKHKKNCNEENNCKEIKVKNQKEKMMTKEKEKKL